MTSLNQAGRYPSLEFGPRPLDWGTRPLGLGDGRRSEKGSRLRFVVKFGCVQSGTWLDRDTVCNAPSSVKIRQETGPRNGSHECTKCQFWPDELPNLLTSRRRRSNPPMKPDRFYNAERAQGPAIPRDPAIQLHPPTPLVTYNIIYPHGCFEPFRQFHTRIYVKVLRPIRA